MSAAGRDFDAALAGDAPLAEDFEPAAPVLLVAFGGLKGAPMGLPPFEFQSLSRAFPVKRMFLRDPAQAWYLRGLPGVAPDLDGVARHLRARVAASGARRVVATGNSMGAWAALLFGALLDVDAVLAFAPQTFLGPVRRWLHRDGRWSGQVREAQRSPTRRPGHLDLRGLLRRLAADHGPPRGAAQVHYGLDEPLDALHARRLAGLPGITLQGHATGGHALVRHLRDSGRLLALLGAALELPARPEDGTPAASRR